MSRPYCCPNCRYLRFKAEYDEFEPQHKVRIVCSRCDRVLGPLLNAPPWPQAVDSGGPHDHAMAPESGY